MTTSHDANQVRQLLSHNVRNTLKNDFIGKDDLIDLLILSAIAHEHLLLIGPPGTAKSELVKRFVLLIGGKQHEGDLFEYLLTRFTEPNEIFGPVNISAFQRGTFTRNTERALPRARIAFLDEVFKANSAILNALLTILNERFFFNGLEQVRVPLISVYGATNEVPEGDELAALYDRFLVRVRTDNVAESQFTELLTTGWKLERQRIREGRLEELESYLALDDLQTLYLELAKVNLEPIFDDYRELVRQIRAEGITLSDRRVIKLLKLVAAATLWRGEQSATAADLWVLLHIWNNPDQIATLQAIVGPVVEDAGGRALKAERSLQEVTTVVQQLQQRIQQLEQRIQQRLSGSDSMPTITACTTLLHDLEHIRHELESHSAQRNHTLKADWQKLQGQVETLIDRILDEVIERI